MHIHVHMCVHMLRSFSGICLNMPLSNNVHLIPASLEKMPHITSGTVFQHGAMVPWNLFSKFTVPGLTNPPSLLRVSEKSEGIRRKSPGFPDWLTHPWLPWPPVFQAGHYV